MENASAEFGKKRAAILVALLWAGTSALYLLHPQAAVPLVVFPGFGDKSIGSLAGLLAAALVCSFPLSRSSLLFAFLTSTFSCLAWHSWLGAYQPLVPVAFLFLLVFRRAGLPELRCALFQSVCMGLLAVTLHRLNTPFLTGAEFAPGNGALSRDVPEFLRSGPAIAGGLGVWSVAWLLSTALPLAAFALKRRRTGWWLLVGCFFLLLPVYRVLFYGFFLAVPALCLVDPKFLQAWRGEAAGRKFLPVPWLVYLGSLLTFLLWYLCARQETWPYFLAMALGLLAALGSTWSPEARQPAARGRASIFWGTAWLVYLTLPFVWSSVPPPFALTQFSARELRYPLTTTVHDWRGITSCDELRSGYALRWGYRAWQQENTCKLLVYRALP